MANHTPTTRQQLAELRGYDSTEHPEAFADDLGSGRLWRIGDNNG